MLKFKYYSDAGHGWIAVKKSLLETRGLLSKVSAYSYQSKSGQTIYLEEDRDAGLLLKQLDLEGIKYELESIEAGDRSPIRSYQRFSAIVW